MLTVFCLMLFTQLKNMETESRIRRGWRDGAETIDLEKRKRVLKREGSQRAGKVRGR